MASGLIEFVSELLSVFYLSAGHRCNLSLKILQG